jgi:kynureninase
MTGARGDASAHPMFSDELAQDLDARDPLAAFRARFHVPPGPGGEPVIYFGGNSLGLAPRSASERVEREMQAWARMGVAAHFKEEDPWMATHEPLAAPLARLAGALPEEVVAMNSLTVNLHLMMTSFYRPRPGRAAVVMEDRAFPSDAYAVQTHLRSRGIDPGEEILIVRPASGRHCPGTEDFEALLEREKGRIALILLEGVNYATGQAFDLPRIAAAAKRHGLVLGLDLAHAIGNVPLALHDWGIDFAVWCSYKYLNGGPGAVGGCFVHASHASDLSLPRLGGWWGNDPATRFAMRPDFVPRPGADGWQLSNPPVLALAPLKASLQIFEEAGMEALRAKSVSLTACLEASLASLGEACELITPRDPAARGCQLSLRFAHRAREVHRALAERGVVADFREPDLIRVAPVPLYNRFEEVLRFSRILAGIVAPSSPGI